MKPLDSLIYGTIKVYPPIIYRINLELLLLNRNYFNFNNLSQVKQTVEK